MSKWSVFAAIFLSAVCTLFLRALPFSLLGDKKEVPGKIGYLGRVLPSAIMAVLIVYCMQEVSTDLMGAGIYKLIAVVICAALHLWKKNTLISVVGSTGVYMLLHGIG